MSETRALLLTDVVDSTQRNVELGDVVMARLWAAHDQAARDLVRIWRGTEVGRSDGFLLLFLSAADAVGFALAYHRALAGLEIALKARVGVHVGPVILRSNSAADTAQGATPFEIDGVALPAAARVMSTAIGGQTLLSNTALLALGATLLRTQSHGHWRLKGLAEPMELFEIGDDDAPFTPPPDSPKTYRVVRHGNDWMPARAVPNNLPAERDAFIGRDDALQALAEHFDDGARLITVLGIGGIGKTRLSLCHARSWLGDYPGGAWFCDLSSATSSDGIVHAVAQGLDVPLGKADAVQQLGAAIKGRGPCLVILDNFEQVARHAEETLGVWLERAPEARFIVTSREVLGIVGEQTLVLAPMDSAQAVEMFRQRVRAVGGKSQFGDDDEAALVPLVDLLDRLPLAIELAAARGRVMAPRVLLQRMGERFKLLATRGGRRDRQATLRAALDWSWDLLSPVEQSALAQLSVFEGGFTLEAAEAVVDVSALDEAAFVVDVVQALVEKSLVRRGLGPRFDMLRSVQDYAQEVLAGKRQAGLPQISSAQGRHRHYFANLGEHAATAADCADLENLVAACHRAVDIGEADTAVGALENCWAALRLTGPFTAAVELSRAVLGLTGLSVNVASRAAVVVGSALFLLGRLPEATAHLERGLQSAQEQASPTVMGRLLCALADVALASGKVATAEAHLAQALAIALSTGDHELQFRSLNGQGALYFSTSRLELAASAYKKALTAARTRLDTRGQGGVLGSLGAVMQSQGHLTEAREHYEESIRLTTEVGDRRWEGGTRCNLALLLHELGQSQLAAQEFERLIKVARDMGHNRLLAVAQCNLGIVLDALDQSELARGHLVAAVALAQDAGDSRSAGQFMGYLSLLQARCSEPALAGEGFVRACAILKSLEDTGSLAQLHSQWAHAEVLAGHLSDARVQLAMARQFAADAALQDESEIAQALRRVQDLIASADGSLVASDGKN